MSSPFQEIEGLYSRALKDIQEESTLCAYLLKIYQDLVLKISDSSLLQFNTLFARVSYLISKYQISKAWAFAFQIPRREIRQRQLSDKELIPILKACIEYMIRISKGIAEESIQQNLTLPSLPKLPASRKAGRFKKSFARVIATEWIENDKTLLVLDEEDPGKTFVLHYSVTGVNDIFSDTLELAIKEMGLPLILGLVEIDGADERDYVPGYIIIMPDLLLDVTSIADFHTSSSDPLAINLLNQYLPTRTTVTLLIGKLANYFLDELIRDSSIPFAKLFSGSFRLFPLEFIRLTDHEVKGLMKQMQTHYDTIRDVIDNRFPGLGIIQSDCIIEPSYFSPEFGIKGRLDLYYQHDGDKSASIIELKSGKPFKPNSYGLSSANYHQTLLYELLIKAVHGPQHYRANFILYSAMSDNPLRYAVSVESIQKETIHNRNQLALLQYRLTMLDEEDARDILREIDPASFESLKGYVKTDISEFHRVYSSLSLREQEYVKAFSAFASREHMLARIGNESEEGSGGLAGLWLDTLDVKEARYQILRCLEMSDIQKEKHQTQLTLLKTSITNPLANFRAGDIAVLYPFEEEKNDPTHYQLHRANVISVDAISVTIRLRNQQINTKQIEAIRYWNLEHDLLDSSFRSLYQSLWSFAQADVNRRKLILGEHFTLAAVIDENIIAPSNLTPSQKEIYLEGLRSGFLYLLWGPPGTGKTSVMLKSWIEYYYQETNSRMLLLAYTNRAVDEICAALHQLDGDIPSQYLRIGSRAATNELYRHRLIDLVIEPMVKRKEINALLEKTRIIVGTVASIQGKSELFELLQFDVMMVDEASQLLEPSIVGLLTQTKKAILIGDHMQLPAVSVQPASTSKVKTDLGWAKDIGITDLSMSYFERLYRHFQNTGWHHLIGSLHEQGRMHEDIMAFVNRFVYKSLLTCVQDKVQNQKLHEVFPGSDHPLTQSRLIFIPSKATLEEAYRKTNDAEAHIVIALIQFWQVELKIAKYDWTIGVITPFRAQIAAITYLAHQSGLDLTNVTIDTVERYQGGARDIIIMSCAANHHRSLDRISSLNIEGIDRKLNVAVTRARQQFILTGIEGVLKNSKAYSALIDASLQVNVTSLMPDHPILDQQLHAEGHLHQAK